MSTSRCERRNRSSPLTKSTALALFCREIGLEWGGVDVLRDRNDGKLYIVDANKTDMGPPIALNLADKIVATRMLARAFRDYVAAR